ncbi:MAG: anthranilate synthase component I [Actinomycetota bacterium]|nr:anthranilate synthase component I [Actinomycetota bacterium]
MTGALFQPAKEAFLALARDHAVVPVWREVLADLQTPVAVYDRLRGQQGPAFLLESVERGERWGRYSFIGLRPLLELSARAGGVRLRGPAPPAAHATAATGDPLATLAALVATLRAPQLPGLPPLFAGAVGYLGYDVVRFIERVPDTGVDDLGLDDVRMIVPGQLVAFDHLRQRLLVVSNVLVGAEPDTQYDAAVARSEELVARLSAPVQAPSVPPPHAVVVDDAEANMTRETFLDAVERCKDHIRAGDAFQVVPSHRLSLRTDADPFAVYRVLRVINPSPYLYLFDFGDLQVVGSSPEALVTMRGGEASIWPIAGSRPRGATDEEDAALEASLLADAKERAEHVMLVDLARNDLGRVCELGSVRVGDFMQVVRYSHVMHLRSTVSGRVRAGVGPVDVLRATFPAGTLTGAPKVRAMEIIDELEPSRRGLYGGGIGYLDLAGNLDLCIAIRTLVFKDGRAHVQAGAGVVADSVPEREYEETQSKAMALLAAVRAAEAFSRGQDPAWPTMAAVTGPQGANERR